MALAFHRERYSNTGGIHASGISNLLGRPHHDPLATLIRESFQNSWDARLRSGHPMSIRIIGLEEDRDRAEVLRNGIFCNVPAGTRIEASLRLPQVSRMLLVVDRGTSGLSGPYRIEDEVSPREKPHFRDFVWVWGGRHEEVKGGTYGYGKAALYNASNAKTIVVHTRCHWKEDFQERLIICSIHVNEKDHRYTGRMWWGKETSAGNAVPKFGPLVGREAALKAAQIGFPGFSAGETGTTIGIIDPVGGMDITEEVRRLGDEAAKWFWPRMTQGTMLVDCQVDDGEPWHPDLEQWPIPDYRKAFHAILALREGRKVKDDTQIFPIECKRPIKNLGLLAFRRCLVPARAPTVTESDDDEDEEEVGDDAGRTKLEAQAVALMRGPQMVVRYLPAGAAATPDLGWVAVFLATGEEDDKEVEGAFAAAEPPAHDDWIPDARRMVDKLQRKLVNVALKRIQQRIAEELAPVKAGTPVAEDAPMAILSRDLGGLTAGIDRARGASRPADPGGRGGGGGGGRAGVTVKPEGRPRITREADRTIILFTYRVEVRKGDTTINRIEASVGAVLDGGEIETEVPAGADAPRILGWKHEGKKAREMSPLAAPGLWTLGVDTPTGIMVGARVRIVTEKEMP